MEYHGPLNPHPGPPSGESSFSIYLYTPWLGGALAGVILFGIAMVIQLAFMRRKGARWIHGLLAFGCLMEIGGYAARIKGHANPFLVVAFVVQYFLIVVAPISFAAAIYLVLSYVTQHFPGGRSLLGLKPRLLVAGFVLMDIVTIAVQVSGAALVGVVQTRIADRQKPPMSTETAVHILLAGLAVQTFCFSVFLALLITAITRLNRLDAQWRPNARKLLFLDLAAAFLIMLRTVYRLAVECQGYFGSANSSQTLFTCLEFLPVVLALAIFCVVPLHRFFPPPTGVQGHSMDGVTNGEVKHQY